MGPERLQSVEPARETIAAYAATFTPRTDMYPLQLGDGRYVTVKKRLDLDLVEAHLQGTRTLGAYALDPENRAKWICCDADDDREWAGLFRMAVHLEHQRIPVYLEPSRRGGHLWLFTEPMDGARARRFGTQLLAEYDLESVELFPKQDRLSTGPGSLVRLPLGRHRKTGRRYHFITPAGEPLAPTVRDQVKLLGAPRRVPCDFIDAVVARTPVPEVISPTPRFAPPSGEVAGETLSARIKSAISVYDFVAQYVDLDVRGMAHCPFHEDRHKSFGVNRGENFWHCFRGCGGGSVIDFAMKWRELQGQDPSFTATIKDLADRLFPRSKGS